MWCNESSAGEPPSQILVAVHGGGPNIDESAEVSPHSSAWLLSTTAVHFEFWCSFSA